MLRHSVKLFATHKDARLLKYWLIMAEIINPGVSSVLMASVFGENLRGLQNFLPETLSVRKYHAYRTLTDWLLKP